MGRIKYSVAKDHLEIPEEVATLEEDSDENRLLSDESQRRNVTAAEKAHTRLIKWRGLVVTALKGWVKQESCKLIKLAIPIIITLGLQQAQLFISILYVGHITGSSLELDAVGLAMSLLNVTARSVAIGLATAIDTLSSQAYGHKNYKRVGIILQRGILILFIMLFPIWALWLNTESILLLFHQPPCVARLTSLYMKILCFCVPAWFVFVMVREYLQTQGIVWTFVLVTLLSIISSAILHAILIYGVDLGLLGAAIALSIANSVPPVLLISYICLRGLHKQTWYGWSWESLRGWGQFLKLGLPGLLMTCLPWWSTEVTFFVSGYISKTELAVNSIGFHLLIFLFMIPLGIGIAVSIRVGNELGAGNPKSARRASYLALGIAMCIATFYSVLLQATKNHIGKLFTKDEEVIERVALLMNLACIFQFSDEIQVTISGVLRGSGRQYHAAVVNFFCYTIFGVPVGVSLALLTDLGTIGLWTGLAGGNVIQAVTFIILLLRTDWEKESVKAIKRSQGQQQTVDVTSELQQQDQNNHDESDDKECLDEKEQDEFNMTEQKPPSLEGSDLHPHGSNDSTQSASLNTSTSGSHDSTRRTERYQFRVKLLLSRGSFYVVGLAILIVGGVLSQYHPVVFEYDGNLTNCSYQNY